MNEKTTVFIEIRDKCDQLKQLSESLAKEITAIEDGTIDDGDITELDDIQQAMKDIAFEIRDANVRRNSRLNEGSIDKLIKWSGIMALVIEHLHQLQFQWKQPFEKYDKDQIESIGYDLGELMNNHWDFPNDMGFFKDLYNRKSS